MSRGKRILELLQLNQSTPTMPLQDQNFCAEYDNHIDDPFNTVEEGAYSFPWNPNSPLASNEEFTEINDFKCNETANAPSVHVNDIQAVDADISVSLPVLTKLSNLQFYEEGFQDINLINEDAQILEFNQLEDEVLTIQCTADNIAQQEQFSVASELTNGVSTNSINLTEEYNLGVVEEPSETEQLEEVKQGVKRKHGQNKKQDAKKLFIRRHNILEPCDENKCKKQCSKFFSQEFRKRIHEEYWSMSWIKQRTFILNNCSRVAAKRKTVEDSQRQMTFVYRLTMENGEQRPVCKTFFLTTLGYNKKNDRVVFNVLHETEPGSLTPKEDMRGKKIPNNKICRMSVSAHINSFHPNVSHYRREHAPHVKYLPSDITISFMHQDFVIKYPHLKCSYETYRKLVAEENIHFTQLGHEECEKCEIMKQHNKDHDKENLNPDCNTCMNWSEHITRAKKARNMYKEFANKTYDSKNICVSADLQKVIMLPRMDTFKTVVFTNRLVVYNESFVPVGKNQKNVLPFASLWHEAIRGRGKEDIISTFFSFFLYHRDSDCIIFWLGNCSAQNKNWAFLSFIMYIVNSTKVQVNTIEIYYFEPGHTFMSADSFHHSVELKLKEQKKTYDFNDFCDAVRGANKGKTVVKAMNINDFYDFKDLSSTYKRNSTKHNAEKVLLSKIVHIRATRGSFELEYKTDLESDHFQELNFLKNEVMKQGRIKDPAPHTKPYGISAEKKQQILRNLLDLMPENRKEFWQTIELNTI